jgi:DNA topoisomerase-1
MIDVVVAGALVHADPRAPGLRRLGTRRHRFVDARGKACCAEDLERITGLAIPPAWTDVWICTDPSGHIQATGRDAKGRTQYLYHQDWTAQQAEVKFDGLAEFGGHLGDLRGAVDRDLDLPGMPRERVVALVVALMDRTLARIGNDRYTATNGSYGLTTLRNRHARVSGASVDLRFVGKGGKLLRVKAQDHRLARLVKRCQDLPGQELFSYRDGRATSRVTSSDVNDYLREHTLGSASAKTFRTWGATVQAASLLAPVDPPESARLRKRMENDALREVADQLGNTLAVCRGSYVHPLVLSGWADGALARAWREGPRRDAGGLVADERRLIGFLPP